jgi:RNA polymerase sigma factor (sigma-70 family)
VEGRPLEESELVKRAKRGDVSAYEQLVGMHQEVAFRTAWLIAGSTGDAEDAAQDAFVKAYKAIGRFRAEAPFRPWLLSIVANEARNRLRSAARRQALSLRLVEGRSEGGAAPSPEGAALSAFDREAVLRALEKLSPEDRLVISYRYFFELGEAEMAQAMSCPRGTVKSRLSRALQRLRSQLEEFEEGTP